MELRVERWDRRVLKGLSYGYQLSISFPCCITRDPTLRSLKEQAFYCLRVPVGQTSGHGLAEAQGLSGGGSQGASWAAVTPRLYGACRVHVQAGSLGCWLPAKMHVQVSPLVASLGSSPPGPPQAARVC